MHSSSAQSLRIRFLGSRNPISIEKAVAFDAELITNDGHNRWKNALSGSFIRGFPILYTL
jgi:hypothetical protein